MKINFLYPLFLFLLITYCKKEDEVEPPRDFQEQAIDDEKKLPIRDILECKNIGISSGASAPEFLVKNMIKQIEEKAIVKINEVETIKEKIYFKIPNNLN